TERFVRAVKSGELQGDGPPVRWQTSTSLVPLEPKDQALLSGALGRSQGRGVRVIITGRFDYAGGGLLIKSSKGEFSFMPAFVHLNCCSRRIVLERVEVLDKPG